MNKLAYRLLLWLYPVEVRIRWGEDMVDIFARQLDESWLGAWSCALAELFQIALPSWVSRDILVLSLVSSSVSATIFFGLIWALGNSIRLLEISHQLFARSG
ncbi:MAG: hypothetical protein JSU00_17785 [Acidobacteria bacterium]|nr:hypothetical protein [Acidobacteriota bacterium]